MSMGVLIMTCSTSSSRPLAFYEVILLHPSSKRESNSELVDHESFALFVTRPLVASLIITSLIESFHKA